MVAIFMGFVDAVPPVRSACLQPHAIMEVLLFSTTVYLPIAAFKMCTRLLPHAGHQSLRQCSCTNIPMWSCREGSGHASSGQRYFMETRHTWC